MQTFDSTVIAGGLPAETQPREWDSGGDVAYTGPI